MDSDNPPPSDSIPEAPAIAVPITEPVIEVPPEPEPLEPTDPLPTDMPLEAPESPTAAPAPTPVEDQNQALNQPDQSGFIHGLLLRAQAKIQSNRQKKLDKLMALAQKKGQVSNEEAASLLHVSAATATRYLSRLVKEGRLNPTGQTRDLRYRFVR